MTTTTTPAAVATQTTASTVKEIVESLLPSLIAASQPRPYVPPAPKPKIMCRECGMLESICEGKHVQMAVYPTRRPEYADCFQGVSINFVKYLSNSAEHKLTVPECLVGTIQATIDAYEDNEVVTRMGQKKTKKHGGRAQPAIDGWR
jgi:hypothetical protein